MSEYVVAEPKQLYVENGESFEKIRGRVYRYNGDSYTIYLQKVRSRLIKKMGLEDEDDVDFGVKHGDHYELFIENLLFFCSKIQIKYVDQNFKEDPN